MTSPAPANEPSPWSGAGKGVLRFLRPLPLPGDAFGSHLCRQILGIYLMGYYLMYTHWVQLTWLLGGLVLTARVVDWKNLGQTMRRDPFVWSGACFLGWMTLRSVLVDGAFATALPWLGGLAWLVVFVAVVWQAGIHPRALEWWGVAVGWAAGLAAVVSLVVFYFVLPDHVFGERLRNGLVFGGLNPVCAGLGFGFAALWVICIKPKQGGRLMLGLQMLLILALLFTRSRGGLLALGTGQAVLLLVRGWKRTWQDWLALAVAVLAFQASGPAIARYAEFQTRARSGQSLTAPMPVNEMLDRADSGRLEIYRAGVAALPDAKTWLFGIGEWGTDALWKSRIDPQWQSDHLHSAYLATLVQGGLVGLGLLALTLGQGFWRAHRLAARGEDTWLALLCYGGAALLFDGQTLTRMNSLPLFEPLLLTFPLVMAASGWVHRAKAEI